MPCLEPEYCVVQVLWSLQYHKVLLSWHLLKRDDVRVQVKPAKFEKQSQTEEVADVVELKGESGLPDVEKPKTQKCHLDMERFLL